MRQRDIDRYNRESSALWRRHYEFIGSAKVGTMPASIWVDRENAARIMADNAKGSRVAFHTVENGPRQTGIIDEVRKNADGQLTWVLIERF